MDPDVECQRRTQLEKADQLEWYLNAQKDILSEVLVDIEALLSQYSADDENDADKEEEEEEEEEEEANN